MALVIQKITYVLLSLIVLWYIYLFIPKPMTTPNYFDNIYQDREKKYQNTLLYTKECSILAIESIAIHYSDDKHNYVACKKWIEKRDKCISLHLDLKYTEKKFRDFSKICIKNK